MTQSPVTEHALYRWLERVRRIDFSACPPHYRQHDLVQYGCRKIGLTPAEAREEIAPARVQGFIERGATAIRYPAWTLVVSGGSVVTVTDCGKRRRRRTPIDDHMHGRPHALASALTQRFGVSVEQLADPVHNRE